MKRLKVKITSLWRNLFWAWYPRSDREASEAPVKNFWLHWFPARISLRSIGWSYSLWLGTIAACLFFILTITGLVLLNFYIPSIQNAYWSIKDIDNVVVFGWLLRAQHRWAVLEYSDWAPQRGPASNRSSTAASHPMGCAPTVSLAWLRACISSLSWRPYALIVAESCEYRIRIPTDGWRLSLQRVPNDPESISLLGSIRVVLDPNHL